jgi:hypothetical protein
VPQEHDTGSGFGGVFKRSGWDLPTGCGWFLPKPQTIALDWPPDAKMLRPGTRNQDRSGDLLDPFVYFRHVRAMKPSKRMTDLIRKAEGQADHLLNGYIGAVADARIFYPMTSDKEVIRRFGGGARGAGYMALLVGMYRSVVHEAWKITCDTDPSAPSVVNIMKTLEQPGVHGFLRKRYSERVIPIAETADPTTRVILEEMERSEIDERVAEFDRTWKNLQKNWGEFSTDPIYRGIDVLRKKALAHTEIRLVAGRYERLTPKGKMKFGDERKYLERLRPIIDDIGSLVRQTAFTWDTLDKNSAKNAAAFWAPHTESVQ